MLRPHLTLLAGVTMFAVAVPAMAQQDTVIGGPAPSATHRDAATAVHAKQPTARAAHAAHSPRPVEAVTERVANPAGPFAILTSVQRDSIIEHTRSLLGVKYKWAGLNPAKGLDCSGIVKYVFAKLGIDLPHHAATLAKMGDPIMRDTAAMLPGDLLYFGKGKRVSHVGIYVGDGMMIQASSSAHHVVETPVVKYRPPGGLQWKGVRRIVALDTTAVEGDPDPGH
ncbi:MAG: C40 family peptidase [Gemmatimonadales bacterium]